MTAATTPRMTQKRLTDDYMDLPLAATKVLAGTIAVINSSGFVEMGTTATGKVAVGVFAETVDNSGGNAGDMRARIDRGVFRFANSASSDEITLADYGKACYIVDNQTVAKTDGSTTRSAAGIVRGVDAQGVWVEF